jgi:hypothetical protein
MPGRRPVGRSWVTGNVAMAKVLLKADPDLTMRNRFGGISIIPAAERGHVDSTPRRIWTWQTAMG